MITPNPKTLGQRLPVVLQRLGLGGAARRHAEDAATPTSTQLYKQVPVLDSGARGATTTFVQKKIGDVHLAWENEAHLEVARGQGRARARLPADQHSRRAARRRGRRQRATARRHEPPPRPYLKYVYTDEAQEIVAKHFYRPSNEAVLKKHAATFPEMKLFPVTDIAKDFPDAHKQFIAEGGVFDSIYKPKK